MHLQHYEELAAWGPTKTSWLVRAAVTVTASKSYLF
jgi:hypothetical protein